MRPRLKPTISPEPNDRGDIIQHPAFASAYVGRVSGGAYLNGSEFQHQHYVVMRISSATVHRHLSNDWHHSSHRPMLEVAFTEAQWQKLTASMNSLETPCTLQSFDGEMIPEIMPSETKGDTFKREARESAEEALQRVRELVTAIDDANLSGVAKKKLTGLAESAIRALESSLPFILDQFGEHMEDFVEKAKTEVQGYMQMIGAQQNALPPLASPEVAPRRIRRG